MMKRNKWCVVMATLVFTGCTFSAGVKKDLATGLTYSYKGCSVQDVKLVDEQNIPLTDNRVHLNSSIAISASGVQNFHLENGKAYPGCALTIKDTLDHTIAHADDVLVESAKEGITTPGPLNLSATLSFSKPFLPGETYTVVARFFDKHNPGNEIVANVKVLLD